MKEKPIIAVSACLMGQNVRHDGSNASYETLATEWSSNFQFLPICPEIDIGMGVPRGETKLVKSANKIVLMESSNGQDFTEQMLEYAQTQSDFLIDSGICGLVVKSNSASCGLQGVAVQTPGQTSPLTNGKGLFTMVFTTLNPHIPVIEEKRLTDSTQAEHYLSRVQFFNGWLMFGRSGWTMEKLAQFHAENEYFLLSSVPHMVSNLNNLIHSLAANETHPETIALEYMTKAQKSLNVVTIKGRVASTMELVLSKFSERISNAEKQEIIELINGFRTGKLPRNAPLSLLNRYLQEYDIKDTTISRFIDSVPLEMRFSN